MEYSYSFKNKNTKVTFLFEDYYRYLYNICSIFILVKEDRIFDTSVYKWLFKDHDVFIKFLDVDYLISTLKKLEEDKDIDLLDLVLSTTDFKLEDLICDNTLKQKIKNILNEQIADSFGVNGLMKKLDESYMDF